LKICTETTITFSRCPYIQTDIVKCSAFEFVEDYALAHHEKPPDYEDCANFRSTTCSDNGYCEDCIQILEEYAI